MTAAQVRARLFALTAALDGFCEQNDSLETECLRLQRKLRDAELAYAELLRVGAVKAREEAE